MTISRDVFFDYAVRMSTGTKMPVISSDNLLAYKIQMCIRDRYYCGE